MLPRIIIPFILIKIGCAQINGEFWWLSDKFANYIGKQPPPPLFENLKEIDNDESAKVVFKDDYFVKEYQSAKINTERNQNIPLPKNQMVKNTINKDTKDLRKYIFTSGDKFIFTFPNENVLSTVKLMDITTQATPTSTKKNLNPTQNKTVFYNDQVIFSEKLSENFCHFTKKYDCYQNKGIVHKHLQIEEKYPLQDKLICCVVPIRTESVSSKITFPGTTNHNRLKRSKHSKALYYYDDYYDEEDPYVNIKNNKNPNRPTRVKHFPNVRYGTDKDEYPDDYAVEIPSPGLTGLYSDTNKPKDNGYGGPSHDDYEDEHDHGYSLDPRIGTNMKRKTRPHYRPSKLTTLPDDSYEIESQPISYQSDPNFNVLLDFKLPNLTKKRGLKTTRSTTTESVTVNDSLDTIIDTGIVKFSDIFSDGSANRQVYIGCGKSSVPLVTSDNQIGEAEKSSHPWLAMLVPTRKQNEIICYASIIHPRAAITAGDCIQSARKGEVTLIAGLWNLNDRPQSGKRTVIPILHPKYKSGELNNNLAMLHWKRPLKLGENIQPICLSRPSSYHECIFVGWGGFDRAIRSRSRWQRTTVHSCKDHPSILGINLPKDAFCASVKSRATVTGLGGSLVCKIEDRLSAVGIAVSRDSTLILLPVYNWVTSPSIDDVIDTST